jgi:hypothetical protein
MLSNKEKVASFLVFVAGDRGAPKAVPLELGLAA